MKNLLLLTESDYDLCTLEEDEDRKVTAAELRRRVKVQKIKSESVSASRVKTEIKDEEVDLDD